MDLDSDHLKSIKRMAAGKLITDGLDWEPHEPIDQF